MGFDDEALYQLTFFDTFTDISKFETFNLSIWIDTVRSDPTFPSELRCVGTTFLHPTSSVEDNANRRSVTDFETTARYIFKFDLYSADFPASVVKKRLHRIRNQLARVVCKAPYRSSAAPLTCFVSYIGCLSPNALTARS